MLDLQYPMCKSKKKYDLIFFLQYQRFWFHELQDHF